MKALRIEMIEVSCHAGHHQTEAVKEAIVLALTEMRHVRLAHNDNVLLIDPTELIGEYVDRFQPKEKR